MKVKLLKIEEGLSLLETDVKSSQAKEKYTFALRSLKLMQPQEIEILVETILCVGFYLMQADTTFFVTLAFLRTFTRTREKLWRPWQRKNLRKEWRFSKSQRS